MSTTCPAPSEQALGASEPRERCLSDHSYWRMIGLIVAVPLLACLLSFVLVDSALFERYADPRWVQSSNRVYLSYQVPCDVVVYGDSSAITGIDPKVVQQETGLRTCNIAQTKAALVVLGTSALDRFLENNPRPRFLVLQFTGADFYRPGSWDDTTSYMEGVVTLLRFYPKRQFLVALLHHPEIFMGMMHYAYITGPLNLVKNARRSRTEQSTGDLVDVHFIRPEKAFSSCAQAQDIDPIFHKPDLNFIRYLRKRYGPMADHLLIDAAPLSSCDSRYLYLQQHLSGLDNTLITYPFSLYNEGYAHYTAEGAERLSMQLAAQINRLATTGSRPPENSLSARNR